jgi:hypothetical protein
MATEYNFTDTYTNTTFAGVSFTVTVNSSAVDLTDCYIKMNVKRRDIINSQNYEFSTESGLTLVTPLSGIFTFDQQLISIPAGQYKYDMTFYFIDGTVKNYIYGEWNILENI